MTIRRRLQQIKGLAGPEGLYAAVIARATIDVTGQDGAERVVDALAYFHSELYRHHVTALGLPPSARPAVLRDPETLIHIGDMLLAKGGRNEPKTH